MASRTKTQLEDLVVKYREENAALHTKLEAHGTPRNICDDVIDFFSAATQYVEEAVETTTKTLDEAYETSKKFIFSS